MIYPRYIEKDSLMGVPATSAGANTEQRKNKMLNAKKNLEEYGLRLELSDNLLKCINGRSAPEKTRAEEFNSMIKNEYIEMILTATGGEFLIEILPYIRFDLLVKNPKLVAGFSDSTGLLFPITTKYDISTIYGQNFSSFGSEKWHQCQKDFLDLVTGKAKTFHSYNLYEENYSDEITGLEGYNLTKRVYWQTLNTGNIELNGRIIGGCLDVIAQIAGTKYDGMYEFNEKYKQDGIILYFDNCELSMEETIRTLWRLNEFDYFKYAKGIIFGRFGINKTCLDYTVKTCLKDSVLGKMNIPIIFDADITHRSPCMPIINGALATVSVKNGKGIIDYEFV